jgi:hypothetical protein
VGSVDATVGHAAAAPAAQDNARGTTTRATRVESFKKQSQEAKATAGPRDRYSPVRADYDPFRAWWEAAVPEAGGVVHWTSHDGNDALDLLLASGLDGAKDRAARMLARWRSDSFLRQRHPHVGLVLRLAASSPASTRPRMIPSSPELLAELGEQQARDEAAARAKRETERTRRRLDELGAVKPGAPKSAEALDALDQLGQRLGVVLRFGALQASGAATAAQGAA